MGRFFPFLPRFKINLYIFMCFSCWMYLDEISHHDILFGGFKLKYSEAKSAKIIKNYEKHNFMRTITFREPDEDAVAPRPTTSARPLPLTKYKLICAPRRRLPRPGNSVFAAITHLDAPKPAWILIQRFPYVAPPLATVTL